MIFSLFLYFILFLWYRSVAGSYDYESVAIFAILLTLYLWIRSLATTQTMPMLASCLCALSFYYLVACWGGFVLVSNLIPLHVATLIAVNKYSSRVYISYSIFYVVGTLLALTVPIVGFNAIHHAEALASHLVFILVQVLECFESVKPLIRNVWKAKLNSSQKNQLLKLYYGCWYFVIALVCGAVCMIYRGKVVQLTTRVATLFKPLVSVLTPMSNVPSPLVASVSEHQPALWTTFFLDLHLLWILAPIGWILCFEALVDVASTPNALMYSEGIIFLTLFGAVAWYFAGAMVRLMLILAPVACMLSAVTTSKLLTLCIRTIFQYFSRSSLQTSIYLRIHTGIYVMLLCFTYLAILVFGFHASYISSVVYSSPSVIVNVGTTPTGAAVLYDDFREMYSWIRHNTPDNAKIMAWWDYGYQLAAMGNRTTIVDGNTWNSTHIATVGKVLISNEEEALPLLHKMGIDYVLVVFGGVSGYGSDDINKFLWPVRISGNNENSSINMEAIYLNDKNQFDVGENASIALQSSVTYKLCYHNFDKISTVFNEPKGYDRARNVVVSGAKNIHLDIFEEAYTTSHWMMRLYAVKEKPNSNRIVEMSKHKKNGLTVKTRNKKT